MTQPLIPEFEIRMKSKQKASERIQVKSPEETALVCRSCFNEDHIEWVESMIVIALSRSQKILGFYKVSQGGLTGTICDPKVILQFALLSNACGIILCHNHPSGNVEASKADEEITKKIKLACEYHDIKLVDHIILTAESYISFREECLLL